MRKRHPAAGDDDSVERRPVAQFYDPYRPRYHFCVPEDNGRPGDPNGCFCARGRYHLMYFAPEALVDDRGRQIMWAWLTDNPGGEAARGWSGVYGLPRTLWLGDDGTLRMRPVKELETLRSDEQTWSDVALADGQTRKLENVVGDACELEITLAPPTAGRCGVRVRSSPGGEEQTLLYDDAAARQLVFDATRSGTDGRRAVKRAPLELKDGEPLQLRVFVDRSVIEVYANDRQAICRRVYPGRDDSLDAVLFADGGEGIFRSVKAWEMMSSNPY